MRFWAPKAPPPLAKNNRRVTEVYSDAAGGSRGSGFLLGAGLILTARHVLRPQGSGPPTKIIARPLGIASRVGRLQAAELVWPDPAELANLGIDVALIRLVEPPLADEFPENAEIGNPDEEPDSRSINVFAVGFPEFTPMAADRHETEQLNGRVNPGNGLVGGRYVIEDLTLAKPPADLDTLRWNGFSGAALRVRNRVIGVMTLQLDGRRYDFSAIRMETLLNIPSFKTAVGRDADIAGEQASETAPPPTLTKLACLYGRDEQEEEFRRYYKRTKPANGGSARAMLCALPGAHETAHCPNDLADRFMLTVLRDFKWPPASRFELLQWPTIRDRTQALEFLREELWSLLCPSAPEEVPAAPAPFRELIARGIGSRVFYSNVTNRPLDQLTAELVVEWSHFWAALSADHRPPIHLLLMRASTADEVRAQLGPATGFEGIVIDSLSHLDDCSGADFTPWIDRVRRRLDPRHQHWPDHLELHLSQDFAEGTFKMKALKDRIGNLALEAERNA